MGDSLRKSFLISLFVFGQSSERKGDNFVIKPRQDRDRYLCCEGSGVFFAKKGSIVAMKPGNTKIEGSIFGATEGSLISNAFKNKKREIMGTKIDLMKVEMTNDSVLLADEARYVSGVNLQVNEMLSILNIDNLLAYYNCELDARGRSMTETVIGEDGFFKTVLTGRGNGSWVALLSKGNPYSMMAPIIVDPDAVVAWKGNENPRLVTSHNTMVGWLKKGVGKGSGESYFLRFDSPQTQIIIQPYEV